MAFVCALMLQGLAVFGQSGAGALGAASDKAQALFRAGFQATADTVWDLKDVEVKPEYPGGEEAFFKRLAKATHYPDQAFDDGAQGTVQTEFVVGPDGRVRDIRVVRGVRGDLDTEALRVLHGQPKWKPGQVGGVPVATRVPTPIHFRLR